MKRKCLKQIIKYQFKEFSKFLLILRKYATFVTIKVHEMFSKNFPEFNIHPEVKINLEILEYHLNYNIPIDKKVFINKSR